MVKGVRTVVFVQSFHETYYDARNMVGDQTQGRYSG